ncbi:hypothetical protein DFP72DRAFT_1058174 [Ephemerocybe angulata]|uniref:Aldehyde dehydrogenase domain-containing protein n=1 Tax=Ephemerocybe angulata TaxID=980116 RepID=A0A8H6IIL8_9AGAR|nr:hypothetical protein DFP72DRAFT_1058174 [Tulosesus angulatus]
MSTPLPEIDEIHASISSTFLPPAPRPNPPHPDPTSPATNTNSSIPRKRRRPLPRPMARRAKEIEKSAEGAILNISPWNYPIILTLQPLCGAIAAGCPALLEPSDVVPTFSKLLAELVPKYLEPAAYCLVLGWCAGDHEDSRA